MAFNFAAAKTQCRQVVHTTLAVAATYQDSTMSAAVPLNVRWHNKTRLQGDIDHEGYGQLEDSADRVVLANADATSIGVKVGGTIQIPAYNLSLVLRVQEPDDGPYDTTWQASRA